MKSPGLIFGFDTVAELVAFIREKEGYEACEGYSDRELFQWFVCTFYGPHNLSATYQKSVQDLLCGRRRQDPPGALSFRQKNRTVFALPPAPFWHWAIDAALPEEAHSWPYLYVTTGTPSQLQADDWRGFGSYIFYTDWPELRAAYRVARLLLAGKDAEDELRRVPLCIAGGAHVPQLGNPMTALEWAERV